MYNDYRENETWRERERERERKQTKSEKRERNIRITNWDEVKKKKGTLTSKKTLDKTKQKKKLDRKQR